jgi:hypothetical protein
VLARLGSSRGAIWRVAPAHHAPVTRASGDCALTERRGRHVAARRSVE